MRTSVICLLIMSASSCLGQRPAELHLQQLIEHWRWKHYWYSATELGDLYKPGREFSAILFWSAASTPSLGFCAPALGTCQYYPDVSTSWASFERKIPSESDPVTAFRQFVASSFGQTFPLGRSRTRTESDFATEILNVILPSLDPPESVRERKRRPSSETDALVANLGCPADQRECRLHLLIPFYGKADPWVPVYRECSTCRNKKPMIVFMRFVERNWWHGVGDFDDSPDFVTRTRRQIENALMIEVNR